MKHRPRSPHLLAVAISLFLLAMPVNASANGEATSHSSLSYSSALAAPRVARAGTAGSVARLLPGRLLYDARLLVSTGGLRRARGFGTALVSRPKPLRSLHAPVETQPEPDPPASTTVSHSAPAASSGGTVTGSVNWYAIAQCESGGNWSINTGNGYWGGLQFSPGTWFAYGGGPFNGVGPFPYSAAQQIAVAERVLRGQGIGAWPYCGRFG